MDEIGKKGLLYELHNMWNQFTQHTEPAFQDKTEQAYNQIKSILEEYFNEKDKNW